MFRVLLRIYWEVLKKVRILSTFACLHHFSIEKRWLKWLGGGKCRPVPTSVGRTLYVVTKRERVDKMAGPKVSFIQRFHCIYVFSPLLFFPLPSSLPQAWVTLRQCVSGAIVASLRILSLAVTPHPLETYSTLAQTLIQAQVNHIQSVSPSTLLLISLFHFMPLHFQNPGLQPPTGVEDMPIFARSVLKQACKNNQSTWWAN